MENDLDILNEWGHFAGGSVPKPISNRYQPAMLHLTITKGLGIFE